ncbi:MAG: DoxX family protein [Bacteroidetes bacterium]|nr:DoxX family protein [Bacteroidota bacterium]
MENNSNSKILNVTLWAAQVILACMFIIAGYMKTTTPIAQLSASLPWTGEIPAWLVRFIGASELLGALGLLLPSLLRIKPILTPLAASGIICIMLMASIFHLVKNEFPLVAFTLLLGLVAAFIAWGRFTKVPVGIKNKPE